MTRNRRGVEHVTVDCDVLKTAACAAVDACGNELKTLARDIWAHPELGFKEHRTAARVAEWFQRLNLSYRSGLAVTGVRADWDSGSPGPTIAVLGELDALPVPDHPDADAETGAVHACSHHSQLAAMLGCAAVLQTPEVGMALNGRVAFIAVPAEEYVDLAARQAMADEGLIHYLGGKGEMVRLGVFDDIDMAVLVHAGSAGGMGCAASMNGFVAKQVTFRGRAAHAGLNPHEGVNALYAANLAISAINAQRDTFREEDCVRVHHVLTRGGDAVNVVPEVVVMEAMIRAASPEAIADADAKVQRCLRAGAMAMGCTVEIRTSPGYLPLITDPDLLRLCIDNSVHLGGEGSFTHLGHRGSSSDIGDISQLMPAVHPYTGGAEGGVHTGAFRVVDEERAYVDGAKLLAMCVIDLLTDKARRATDILERARPAMTKAEYLAFQESMQRYETFDYA